MADSKDKKVENTFMDFKAFERNTARLQWVLALLAHMEIPYEVNENCVLHQACVVRLRPEDIVPATELIQLEIAASISVSLDDLHPQHSFFTRDMARFQVGEGVSMDEFPTPTPPVIEGPTEAQQVAAQVDSVLDKVGDTQEQNSDGKADALGLSSDDDDEDDDATGSFFDNDDDDDEGSEDDEDDEPEPEPQPEIEIIEGKEWKAAEAVLTHSIFTVPGTSTGIQMFETPSGNLHEYGFRGLKAKEEGEKPKCVVFARFKSGGTLYRYKPVSLGQTRAILSEAVKRAMAEKAGKSKDQHGFSAGSLFSTTIRTPADEGKLTCHRLTDEGKWMEVLPKHLRPKKSKK